MLLGFKPTLREKIDADVFRNMSVPTMIRYKCAEFETLKLQVYEKNTFCI